MRLALLILCLMLSAPAHAGPVAVAIAIWAGVSVATVYLAATVIVLSAGMAVYGSAQARRAERDARNQAKANMQDRMATRIAGESPHRYIYGRARVGSDIVAMFTSGSSDQFKHLVCVHAAHECDAIEEVYVANVAVGLVNEDGDATTGRFFSPSPGEIIEEAKVGPTFVLNRYPVQGSIYVYSGSGANMAEVAITVAVGSNVTVAFTGPVRVVYEWKNGVEFNKPATYSENRTNRAVVKVQRHLGGVDDVADAYLRSQIPGKWAETAVLRGLCYTVVSLDLSHPEFQSGQVPVHALIRGKKLYDPRTGVAAWSANPALAIYDYLISPICGVDAADLPLAQFITAANVCDEATVAGGLYTINGSVTSDQSQSSVLETMAQCMAGGIVSTTWDIYAGKYVAPVAALLQSDIVGSMSITPGVSDAAIYNGVKGQFISPENKYVLTDFKPYQNAVYRENDGRDYFTDIDFPFTDSLQRVTNLARIFTEDQRNGFTVKAEFSLKAWPLKVGQRVTLTSAFLGQTSKVYRVTDKAYSPNSAVALTLKEDAASIWDLADATDVDSTPNTDLPDPWEILPLTALTCESGEATLLRQADGTMIPRMLVSWPAAESQGVISNGQIEIEFRAVGTSAWEKAIVSGGETHAYLSPITPGFFYVVRARCVNPYLNTKSEWIIAMYQVQVFAAHPVVYMWAASQPAPPNGAGSYAWSASAYAAPAGWSLTIPAAPGGGNQSLWEASLLVSDVTVSGSTQFDWAITTVVAIGYAPAAAGTGPAGYSNARVFAYQRAATAPTLTPGAVNYDFTTATITTATLANGWLKTIPASDGNPLYVTSASASSAGTTDAIASGEWSGAVVLAYDGGAGTAGLNNATITLYQRSASSTSPTKPSALATYTFATGALAGLNNGWTTYIPSSGGAYLHTTLATAIATTATDTIASTEWATVQLMYDAAAVIAAQADATAAAGQAALALTKYDNIAADSVLDRSEKAQVVLDWQAIDGEASGIITQADTLGVSRTAYLSAYNSLATYLAGLAPAYTDTTLDTSIVRTTFNSMFSGYYTAKSALLNAIAAKTATLATWSGTTGPGKPADYATVGADAGNLQVGVGSRNMLSNSLPRNNSGYSISTGGTLSLEIVNASYLLYANSADGFAIYTKNRKGCLYVHAYSASSGASVQIFNSNDMLVSPGQRYEFGIDMSAHRCTGTLVVYWYNAAGTYIGFSAGNSIANSAASYEAVPFPRATLFVTAPGSAKFCKLLAQADFDGQSSPYLFTSEWYGGLALNSVQTVPSAWTEMSADSVAYALTAKAAADAAATQAALANAAIQNASLDSVLDPTEKPAVIQQWAVIVGENGAIIAQADTLGVSRVAYANALSALNSYLPAGWDNTTTSTGVVRLTFNGMWADYYTAKQALLNAIDTKIQANAAAAQSTATFANNTANAATAVLASPPVISGLTDVDVHNITNGSSRLIESLSVSMSGGEAPYTYVWSKEGSAFLTAYTGASVDLKGSGSNSLITGRVTCIGRDNKGRTSAMTIAYTAGFGSV